MPYSDILTVYQRSCGNVMVSVMCVCRPSTRGSNVKIIHDALGFTWSRPLDKGPTDPPTHPHTLDIRYSLSATPLARGARTSAMYSDGELKRQYAIIYCYRPRSEVSEGYIFTGICLSNYNQPPPPGTRSQHPPPPGPGHNTPLPPPTRSQHSPWDQVTTPQDYAQAGGTHPTGMHTCYRLHMDYCLFTGGCLPSEGVGVWPEGWWVSGQGGLVVVWLEEGEAEPPSDMATAAAGTHPTGMLLCYNSSLVDV